MSMKNSLSISIIVLLAAALLYSCSRSIEKKIAGMWKVEDVQFDSTVPMDPAQLAASKVSAKSVSYELMEDYTAKVHAGMTVLEGNWIYREAEEGVYMAFTGSFDTVLLGRYKDGKLINEASRPNFKITTIFAKED
jgi:hypothetical protein